MLKKEFLEALKNLDLSSSLYDDAKIANVFKIGHCLHKYGYSKKLKDCETLKTFILNHITREDNRTLYFTVDYLLPKCRWLQNTLKTVYLRPEINFLPRGLKYPEMKTAEQFQEIIGDVVLYSKNYALNLCKPEGNIFCLSDSRVGTFKNDLIFEAEQKIQNRNNYTSFYLKINKEFKNKLLKNEFDVINSYSPMYNSIELINHNNGFVLGVYNAEIGSRWLFYMPVEEIKKLYKEGAKEILTEVK